MGSTLLAGEAIEWIETIGREGKLYKPISTCYHGGFDPGVHILGDCVDEEGGDRVHLQQVRPVQGLGYTGSLYTDKK